MDRFPPIDTYVVSENGDSITCLGCHLTSYDPNDVEQHYCGNCHMFHDDLWPPARADFIANTPKIMNEEELKDREIEWLKEGVAFRAKQNTDLHKRCLELEEANRNANALIGAGANEIETLTLLVKGLEGNLKACEEEVERLEQDIEARDERRAQLIALLERVPHDWEYTGGRETVCPPDCVKCEHERTKAK